MYKTSVVGLVFLFILVLLSIGGLMHFWGFPDITIATTLMGVLICIALTWILYKTAPVQWVRNGLAWNFNNLSALTRGPEFPQKATHDVQHMLAEAQRLIESRRATPSRTNAENTEAWNRLETLVGAITRKLDRNAAAIPPAPGETTDEKPHNQLTWVDYLELELALFEVDGVDGKRARMSAQRLEYERIDVIEYGKFKGSQPPPIDLASDPMDEKAVAEFKTAAKQILRIKELDSMIDNMQRSTLISMSYITFFIFFAAGGIILATLIAFTVNEKIKLQIPNVPLLLLVLFAGSMGGFLSALSRIQNLPRDGNREASLSALENGVLSFVLAPVQGMIFAMVLMLVFKGGLIAGKMFPEFDKDAKCETLLDFVGDIHLKNCESIALLLFWCFVSGFLERFVPDAITKISQDAKASGK